MNVDTRAYVLIKRSN